MEFFQSAVDFFSMAVTAVGAVLVVMGIMDFAEGQGNDNPALKNTGGKKMMGGGIIVAVGLLLVPQLSGMISI